MIGPRDQDGRGSIGRGIGGNGWIGLKGGGAGGLYVEKLGGLKIGGGGRYGGGIDGFHRGGVGRMGGRYAAWLIPPKPSQREAKEGGGGAV
jgi:hypothetical protein